MKILYMLAVVLICCTSCRSIGNALKHDFERKVGEITEAKVEQIVERKIGEVLMEHLPEGLLGTLATLLGIRTMQLSGKKKLKES